ncbi:flavin-containing monooxygenase [Pedococcus sp. P5_B7]
MQISNSTPRHVDAIVVGAGFAGLYALYLLREKGLEVQGFEAGSDVGGVWYHNRYPGARCDVESLQYSYSFDDGLQQDWVWSEKFAPQHEILAYLRHVAERFDLRKHIQFTTSVTDAVYDETTGRWTIATANGRVLTCQWLVMASGSLSAPRTPDIPGVESFEKPIFHTGTWPHDGADFSGLRVGVIGTGSSGVQSIPLIAEQAAHLSVFQRTPAYVIPARNGPLDDDVQREFKARYAEHRAEAKLIGTISFEFSDLGAVDVSEDERIAEYDRRWARGGVNFLHAFNDLLVNMDSNATAAEYVRGKVREAVDDPQVAERLLPTYPLGAKRLVIGTNYYETYNRPNVTLVDLRDDPIEQIEAEGIRTVSGLHPLDALIFATGYDALTGALTQINIQGRNGAKLVDAWRDGPMNYLGLMVSGFPNMFIVTGPGSPSVLTNMAVSIEQHVDWIVRCIDDLVKNDYATIEAEPSSQAEWVEHVNEVADRTIYVHAASWYNGGNIPGKPRVFLPYAGGIGPYRVLCDEVAAEGYRGFSCRSLMPAASR